MRVPDNLLIPLLLIAFIADAAAHHRTRMNPAARTLSLALGLAAATLASVFALLVTRIVWPGWTVRGPLFLGISLLALAAAAWLWRDKFGFARKPVK